MNTMRSPRSSFHGLFNGSGTAGFQVHKARGTVLVVTVIVLGLIASLLTVALARGVVPSLADSAPAKLPVAPISDRYGKPEKVQYGAHGPLITVRAISPGVGFYFGTGKNADGNIIDGGGSDSAPASWDGNAVYQKLLKLVNVLNNTRQGRELLEFLARAHPLPDANDGVRWGDNEGKSQWKTPDGKDSGINTVIALDVNPTSPVSVYTNFGKDGSIRRGGQGSAIFIPGADLGFSTPSESPDSSLPYKQSMNDSATLFHGLLKAAHILGGVDQTSTAKYQMYNSSRQLYFGTVNVPVDDLLVNGSKNALYNALGSNTSDDGKSKIPSRSNKYYDDPISYATDRYVGNNFNQAERNNLAISVKEIVRFFGDSISDYNYAMEQGYAPFELIRFPKSWNAKWTVEKSLDDSGSTPSTSTPPSSAVKPSSFQSNMGQNDKDGNASPAVWNGGFTSPRNVATMTDIPDGALSASPHGLLDCSGNIFFCAAPPIDVSTDQRFAPGSWLDGNGVWHFDGRNVPVTGGDISIRLINIQPETIYNEVTLQNRVFRRLPIPKIWEAGRTEVLSSAGRAGGIGASTSDGIANAQNVAPTRLQGQNSGPVIDDFGIAPTDMMQDPRKNRPLPPRMNRNRPGATPPQPSTPIDIPEDPAPFASLPSLEGSLAGRAPIADTFEDGTTHAAVDKTISNLNKLNAGGTGAKPYLMKDFLADLAQPKVGAAMGGVFAALSLAQIGTGLALLLTDSQFQMSNSWDKAVSLSSFFPVVGQILGIINGVQLKDTLKIVENVIYLVDIVASALIPIPIVGIVAAAVGGLVTMGFQMYKIFNLLANPSSGDPYRGSYSGDNLKNMYYEAFWWWKYTTLRDSISNSIVPAYTETYKSGVASMLADESQRRTLIETQADQGLISAADKNKQLSDLRSQTVQNVTEFKKSINDSALKDIEEYRNKLNTDPDLWKKFKTSFTPKLNEKFGQEWTSWCMNNGGWYDPGFNRTPPCEEDAKSMGVQNKRFYTEGIVNPQEVAAISDTPPTGNWLLQNQTRTKLASDSGIKDPLGMFTPDQVQGDWSTYPNGVTAPYYQFICKARTGSVSSDQAAWWDYSIPTNWNDIFQGGGGLQCNDDGSRGTYSANVYGIKDSLADSYQQAQDAVNQIPQVSTGSQSGAQPASAELKQDSLPWQILGPVRGKLIKESTSFIDQFGTSQSTYKHQICDAANADLIPSDCMQQLPPVGTHFVGSGPPGEQVEVHALDYYNTLLCKAKVGDTGYWGCYAYGQLPVGTKTRFSLEDTNGNQLTAGAGTNVPTEIVQGDTNGDGNLAITGSAPGINVNGGFIYADELPKNGESRRLRLSGTAGSSLVDLSLDASVTCRDGNGNVQSKDLGELAKVRSDGTWVGDVSIDGQSLLADSVCSVEVRHQITEFVGGPGAKPKVTITATASVLLVNYQRTIPTPVTTLSPMESGTYTLPSPDHGGSCLAASTMANAAVGYKNCDDSDPTTWWYFDAATGTVKVKDTNSCLVPKDESIAAGAQLIVAPCGPSEAKRWTLGRIQNGDAAVLSLPRLGRCLVGNNNDEPTLQLCDDKSVSDSVTKFTPKPVSGPAATQNLGVTRDPTDIDNGRFAIANANGTACLTDLSDSSGGIKPYSCSSADSAQSFYHSFMAGVIQGNSGNCLNPGPNDTVVMSLCHGRAWYVMTTADGYYQLELTSGTPSKCIAFTGTGISLASCDDAATRKSTLLRIGKVDNVTTVKPRVNIAKGMPTEQSSVYSGGVASRAVDGNTDGIWTHNSVTHTNSDQNAWWSVDLGSSQPIYGINVWGRTDGAQDRLSDYYVCVSDTPFDHSLNPQQKIDNGVQCFHQTEAPNPSTRVALPDGVTGRYVMVQLAGQNYLSLAEVQVISDKLTDQGNNTAAPAPSNSPSAASKGSVIVQLRDSESADGRPLAGGYFGLWRVSDGKWVADFPVTDEAGKATMSDLPPGKYLVYQTEDLPGHSRSDESWPVTVTAGGTTDITVINPVDGSTASASPPTATGVQVRASTPGGSPVSGMHFGLWKLSDRSWAANLTDTDSNGIATLTTELPDGDYLLYQTGDAPNGYLKKDQSVKISIHGGNSPQVQWQVESEK